MTELAPSLVAYDAEGRRAFVSSRDGVAVLHVVDARGVEILRQGLARKDTTNDGYEGCDGVHLDVVGDAFVCVSREQGRACAWRVTFDAGLDHGPRLSACDLPGRFVVDGDVVCTLPEGEHGIVDVFELASFAWRAPIAFPGAPMNARIERARRGVVHVVGDLGAQREQLRTNDVEHRSTSRLDRSALHDLVERVARAFDDAHEITARVTADHGGSQDDVRALLAFVVESALACFAVDRTHGLAWLPLYWSRHLRARGRVDDDQRLRALVALLASADPQPVVEVNAMFAAAARRVWHHAEVLGDALDEQALPRGMWCVLFAPAPAHTRPADEGPGGRIDRNRLAPTTRAIVDELAAASTTDFATRR